jgi:hypothetical protein
MSCADHVIETFIITWKGDWVRLLWNGFNEIFECERRRVIRRVVYRDSGLGKVRLSANKNSILLEY